MLETLQTASSLVPHMSCGQTAVSPYLDMRSRFTHTCGRPADNEDDLVGVDHVLRVLHNAVPAAGSRGGAPVCRNAHAHWIRCRALPANAPLPMAIGPTCFRAPIAAR
jgi:hypothetical protein